MSRMLQPDANSLAAEADPETPPLPPLPHVKSQMLQLDANSPAAEADSDVTNTPDHPNSAEIAPELGDTAALGMESDWFVDQLVA